MSIYREREWVIKYLCSKILIIGEFGWKGYGSFLCCFGNFFVFLKLFEVLKFEIVWK